MRGQKLGIRIALLVAVVVLISYTVTILIISSNIKSSSEEAAFSESKGLALTQAAMASTELTFVQSSVTELSRILAINEVFPASSSLELIDEMLKTTLMNEPRIINTWAYFLPGSLSRTGPTSFSWHNMSGTFIKKTDMSEELPEDAKEVLESGKPIIAEPYEIEKATNDMAGMSENTQMKQLASSIIVPIMKENGEIVGVVGADFSLSFLHERMGKTKVFVNGYGELLTNTARIVMGTKEVSIGEVAHELEDDAGETVKKAIVEGTPFSLITEGDVHGDKAFKYFAPVNTGVPGVPWSYLIVVPYSEIMSKVYRLISLTILIGLVSLGIVIAIIMLVITQMMRPLNFTVVALKDISSGSGDLTKKIPVDRSDEIGMLASHFNVFCSSLASMIGSVIIATERLAKTGESLDQNMSSVSSAITEITSNVQEMQQGATRQTQSVKASSEATGLILGKIERLKELVKRQAQCVSQSSAAVEQMIANVATMATNAVDAGKQYASLVQASESGTSVITDVNQIAQQIAVQSASLSEANEVIASIASKTNLLAMNAAIEAAHAGDYGKGFAVVADEIRSLAESSAEQSKGIENNLKAIQVSITSVVSASEKAEVTFNDVRERITILYTLQEELQRAMVEQKEGSTSTLESLEDIKGATAEVDSASEEMRTASAKVVSEMDSLVSASEEFKRGMEEISIGASEINNSVLATAELTRENHENILEVSNVTSGFKISS